mgnify:CR=1 FL=1
MCSSDLPLLQVEDDVLQLLYARVDAEQGLVLALRLLVLLWLPGVVAELFERSEERRVGKECRSRWSRDH